jgi:hypothetical protein
MSRETVKDFAFGLSAICLMVLNPGCLLRYAEVRDSVFRCG